MNTVSSSTSIALVTGGNRGLGKDMVLSLARRGVDVIFTYRNNQAEAAAVAAQAEKLGRRAVALQLDVGVSATFSKFAAQVREELRNRWQRDVRCRGENDLGTAQLDLLPQVPQPLIPQCTARRRRGWPRRRPACPAGGLRGHYRRVPGW